MGPRVSEHSPRHHEEEAVALLSETVGLYLHSSRWRLRRDGREEVVHPWELRGERYPEWAVPTDDIYLKGSVRTRRIQIPRKVERGRKTRESGSSRILVIWTSPPPPAGTTPAILCLLDVILLFWFGVVAKNSFQDWLERLARDRVCLSPDRVDK